MAIWVRPVIAPITQKWGNGEWGPLGQGGHPGTDYGCPMGTPIVAASDGVVTYAGPAEGFGDHAVSIWHGADGVTTTYGHMEAHYVSVGQTVAHGQIIGLADTEGYSTGPHLHFEVRPGGATFGGNPPNIDSDLWLHNRGAYDNNPLSPVGQLTQEQRLLIYFIQGVVHVHQDGGWGKQTDDALQTIRFHCLTPPNPAKKSTQVAQLQTLFKVATDGVWGPATDKVYLLLRYVFLNK